MILCLLMVQVLLPYLNFQASGCHWGRERFCAWFPHWPTCRVMISRGIADFDVPMWIVKDYYFGGLHLSKQLPRKEIWEKRWATRMWINLKKRGNIPRSATEPKILCKETAKGESASRMGIPWHSMEWLGMACTHFPCPLCTPTYSSWQHLLHGEMEIITSSWH